MLIDYINPYAWAMRVRRALYRSGHLRSYQIDIPVIAIGNLSSGGTGKTPLTLHLTCLLEEKYHKKVGIILRGYKRETTGQIVVQSAGKLLATSAQSGDEAQLYAKEFPNTIVVCDEDRVRGVRKAKELGAQVALLDDAYQHLRIKRDLNILLVNGLQGIPAVIPFSKGRETIAAALDANVIIITNAENADPEFRNTLIAKTSKTVLCSNIEITGFENVMIPHSDVSFHSLHNQTVLVLSGLGSPEAFECSVFPLVRGLVSYRLSDHTRYDAAMVTEIIRFAKKNNCSSIITTTKDAIKLWEVFQNTEALEIPFLIAHSQLVMTEGNDELLTLIENVLNITQ